MGRISLGAIGDRVGKRKAIIAVGLLQTLTLFWLIRVDSAGMLWAWVVFFGFFYGGWGPNLLAMMADLFGKTSTSAMVGVANVSLGIGGAVGPWLAGHIFDTTGSYDYAFALFALLTFLATICAFFLRPARTAQASR